VCAQHGQNRTARYHSSLNYPEGVSPLCAGVPVMQRGLLCLEALVSRKLVYCAVVLKLRCKHTLGGHACISFRQINVRGALAVIWLLAVYSIWALFGFSEFSFINILFHCSEALPVVFVREPKKRLLKLQ